MHHGSLWADDADPNHKAERSRGAAGSGSHPKGYQEAAPGRQRGLGLSGSTTAPDESGQGSYDAIVYRVSWGAADASAPDARGCLRLQGFEDKRIDKGSSPSSSDAQAYNEAETASPSQ